MAQDGIRREYMPEINIKVRDKCAKGEGVIICNNSDYTVVWDLDEEWTPYDTKTMRVNLADGTYQDVVFTGNTATLPVLTASGWVSVGLYAGDIHTSRAARLLALSSVLTPGGSPAAPAEDVYAQIMAKLNELSTVSPEDIAKAVEDYLAEHPAASASMRVEGGYIQFSGDGETWKNVIALADLKGPKGDTGDTGPQGPKGDTGPQGNPGKDGAGMDVTGATVDQTVKIAAVDDNGVPTAWEPVDMPSGGGDGEWVFAGSVTAESAGMALKVSNIHAKHILVSLYASCDDASAKSYTIKLNDAISVIRSNSLPGNGEKHLWAVEFELLTAGDETYIYCPAWPREAHHTNQSNDPSTRMSTTVIDGTMWYKVNISEFNSVTFQCPNGTDSAGNIMNVWYR
jgi:hypothetical protein